MSSDVFVSSLSLYYSMTFFFFFSSRRRHTRYWRDWSSDVCSSDLTEIMGLNNWIAAYKGQIEGLKHELAVTKHHLQQLQYGPAPEPFSGQIAALAREVAELNARHEAHVAQLNQNNAELNARHEAHV